MAAQPTLEVLAYEWSYYGVQMSARFMGDEEMEWSGRSMSMPRKAMKEMGFQTCCLLCDAVDIAGTERCRHCIANHAVVRDALPDNPVSPIDQLAVELMQMLANPHRWDHDPVHGRALRNYQVLAGEFAEIDPLTTSEEIDDLFKRQAEISKTSLIHDVGNQNQWKDGAPSLAEAREINREISPVIDSEAGLRTVPSRDIEKVDLSDRVGEDHELSDRIAATEKAGRASKRELGLGGEFTRRQELRKAWEEEVEGVSELLGEGDLTGADLGVEGGTELEEDTVDSEDDELDI